MWPAFLYFFISPAWVLSPETLSAGLFLETSWARGPRFTASQSKKSADIEDSQGYDAGPFFIKVIDMAANSIKTIEDYINSCLIKGSCIDCPFYIEGKDYLSGHCMGAKQYGERLLGLLAIIKKELDHGKDEKGRSGKDEKRKSGRK